METEQTYAQVRQPAFKNMAKAYGLNQSDLQAQYHTLVPQNASAWHAAFERTRTRLLRQAVTGTPPSLLPLFLPQNPAEWQMPVLNTLHAPAPLVIETFGASRCLYVPKTDDEPLVILTPSVLAYGLMTGQWADEMRMLRANRAPIQIEWRTITALIEDNIPHDLPPLLAENLLAHTQAVRIQTTLIGSPHAR